MSNDKHTSREEDSGAALRLALGATLAVATATLFYYKSDVPTGLAFLSGAIVVVFTIQLEAVFRRSAVDKHLGSLETDLNTLRQIPLLDEIQANGLTLPLSQVSRNPTGWAFLTSLLTTSVVNLANTQNLDDPFAQRLLEDIKTDLSRDLNDLESGRFEVRNRASNDHALALWLTASLQTSLRATSIVNKHHLSLDSPGGREYWAYQKAAMERGVRIERVFVYNDWTDELERLAYEQHSAGVKAFRVRQEKLRDNGLLYDMALWDERYASALSFDAGGSVTDSMIWFKSNDSFSRTQRSYDRILDLSESYPISR